MKSVPVEILPAAARGLKEATRSGYVVLTRNGKPIAYVLPTSLYDEEDIGYMTDPQFWAMIAERRKQTGEGIPLEQVEAEIAAREAAGKQAGAKLPRNDRKAKKTNEGR